jgi:ABC-type enterochelin transport system permease subunit
MLQNFKLEELPDIIRAYSGPWLIFGFLVAIITKVLPPTKQNSKRLIGMVLCLYVALQIAGQCKHILPHSELFSQAYFFVPAAYLVITIYEKSKANPNR